MTKKFVTALAITGLMLSLTPALAAVTRVPVEHQKASAGVNITLPERAVEVAPNIFDIGTSVDTDGAILQGYAIIHPKANKAKPQNPGNGGGSTTSTCYAFLGKGAKWKSLENYIFDPANTAGLNTTTVQSLLASSLEKWDTAAGAQIFGSEVAGAVNTGLIGNATNDQNEVIFASIASPGAIAVTYAWGIFGGPIQGREIREWDMVFDQADFSWNTDGNADDMDFENIATHEIGHAAGMGHPSDSCSNETMYRYASEGETKKRDLNAGDIVGIGTLY